ncbi:MAG TPA: hypothetical protein VFR86_11330 [Burkholderiaceae bacterium]|nr:hypothetical protein [Burkholderiaceae bacterium]
MQIKGDLHRNETSRTQKGAVEVDKGVDRLQCIDAPKSATPFVFGIGNVQEPVGLALRIFPWLGD